jgi:iron complex outermembrane recepter protein
MTSTKLLPARAVPDGRRTLIALLLSAALPVAAQVPSVRELTQLSLEELSDLNITSVSRKVERLSDAAASVFVITGEDIRRSGARSLPEVLRLAPNLHVSRSYAGGYSINARGMSLHSANKLLVLIDGRSVYTPLFAGVFWDVQHVMLEDVERIEVVSGPGGTLWGVNAVNGVINVITRAAKDTQGVLAAASAATLDSAASLRHGGSFGGGHYRVFGQYADNDRGETASGAPVNDAGHFGQAGFRADWSGDLGQLTLNGNAYRGAREQPEPGSVALSGFNLVLGDIPVEGANLTARWERRLASGSSLVLQAYYDRTERVVPPTFAEKLDIVDLQVLHSIPVGERGSLAWGAEYRRSRDRLVNGEVFAFLPADLEQEWSSLFAQHEMPIGKDLRVIVGARIERNDYTGTELLPNARLAWSIAPDKLLWAAASRTVRAPSRLDRDVFVPARPPFLLRGGPDVRSEVANVYEVGYRGRAGSVASYSATVFHADYDRLHTQEIGATNDFFFFAGMMRGSVTGVEAWGTVQAAPGWRLSAGYTALRERLRLHPGSRDVAAPTLAGRDPAHQWIVRSSLDLGRRWELDVGLRHVSALSAPAVPAYSVMDVRLGWRIQPGLELAIGGRDLFHDGHGEIGDIATRARIEPTAYASLRWAFGAR